MMVLHPQAAKAWALPDQRLDLVMLVCNAAKQSTKETVHLLALRALTNFFGRHALTKHIVSRSEEVLELVATLFERCYIGTFILFISEFFFNLLYLKVCLKER